MKRFVVNFMLLALFSVTVFYSCTKDEEFVLPSEKEFVGSQECASCHVVTHQNFMESGHPYKLSKVINNQQPNIPFMPTASTPDGYTWNDISYTIGGYGWKMRFIDNNGYVITQVPGSQWDPQDNSRSVYNGSTPNGTEKYTCGGCHTTGWKSIANGGMPQGGLAGMGGEFFAGGVHCEACHGEGNVHIAAKRNKVQAPSNLDVRVDKTNNLCAQCHYRRWDKGDYKQQVSGGWEMHRNQMEQLSTNAHINVTCSGCHDPHSSTKKDAVAKGNGIKANCTSCHTNSTKYATSMHYNASCVDCHMPHTAKNGISFNKYRGDAPNHNFKINTSATDTYLTADGAGVLWANANLKGTTLDFACYKCHKDAEGVGGTYSTKTRAELSTKAVTFHK
jgi:predicted CXXCH cytochrome family protein